MSFALFVVGYVVLSVVVTSGLLRFFPEDFERSDGYGYGIEGTVDNLLIAFLLLGWPVLALISVPIALWAGLVWLVKHLAGRSDA